MTFPTTMDRTKGGRASQGIDKKVGAFKNLAWDLIIDRCTRKNTEEAEKWLDRYITMFSGRLMPDNINYGKEDDNQIESIRERIIALEKGRTEVQRRITDITGTVVAGAIETGQATAG